MPRPTALHTQDLADLLHGLLGGEAPQDAAARVASARGIWAFVCLQLACVDPPVKAAKVLQYAEDVQYLEALQQVGEGLRQRACNREGSQPQRCAWSGRLAEECRPTRQPAPTRPPLLRAACRRWTLPGCCTKGLCRRRRRWPGWRTCCTMRPACWGRCARA